MAEGQERLDLLAKIKKFEQDIADVQSDSNLSAEESLKRQEALRKKILGTARELKNINAEAIENAKEQRDLIAEQQSSISSISESQFFLKDMETERVDRLGSINTKVTKNIDLFGQIANVNREIASLGEEETLARAQLLEQYDSLAASVDKRGQMSKEQLAILNRQREAAVGYSQMSEKQKELLTQQRNILEGISSTIQGVVETTVTLYGNVQGAFGGLLTLSGFFVNKLGEVNSELGVGFQLLNGQVGSATALSFVFDDAVGNLRALTNEFGNIEDASFGTQLNVGLMSKTMGISGEEASKLTGLFARLNGGSTDIAADMIKTTQQFSKQNNVIPSDVLSDMAASAEEVAVFADESGENIAKAAVFARQLGTNLSTVTGIADNLLDFESSITKELELGALLGRNINLNKARQLAFEDDLVGATEEVLNQLGGIAEYEQMNYYQRKATADLLGVSVGELQKMVQNQENVGTRSQMIKEEFSKINELTSAFANEYLGMAVKGMGGLITASAQVAGNFALISGVNLGGLFSKMGSGLSKVSGSIGSKIGGLFGKTMDKVTNTPTPGDGIFSSIAKGIEKFASPAITAGLLNFAGAMGIITVALIGLGFALKVAAPGIKAFGEAFGTIIKSIGTAISTIVEGIGNFIVNVSSIVSPEMIAGIFGLAAGFTALTASMSAFALVGTIALPSMIAVGTLASLGVLGGESDGEGTIMDELLGEMKGLRQDLTSGKVAVYIDGKKVTGALSNVISKDSTNSFGRL